MAVKTILHLIETSGPGGAEKMLISLVESLDQKKYQSVICLLKDGWLNTQLRQRGFDTVIIPQRKGLDLGWVYKCVQLIGQQKIALLHAHEFTMNVYGCAGAWISRVPIITTVHGKSYYGDRRRRQLAYRFVARHSSKMVAVSEDIRRFLIERVGVSPDKLVTIYNGIDPKTYRRSRDGAQLRKELGIAKTASVIGTVGNLYPVKGHTYLLKAVVGVVRIFPETIFLIVGRGSLLSQLQEEVHQLGIEKHVQFLGFSEDVPALLQAMDLFILPSMSEGLSLSLLEAMAAGKPVVVTNVGGNPEVVVHGETGFLVPAKDPEKLAFRIISLLKDKLLAQKFGASGQQRLHEKFSFERMVNAYQRLYEEVLLRR